jgi:metal-responsive CopG/Arc/MetJ family transcriptional regulator
MKPIQITLDAQLLEELDRTPEVKAQGRSAIVRRALREYLDRRREAAIAAAYRRGYGEKPVTRDEFPLLKGASWPER